MTIAPNDDTLTAPTDPPDEGSASAGSTRDGDGRTIGELRPWRAGAAVAAILVFVAIAAIAVVYRPTGNAGSSLTMMGGATAPIAGMRAGCEQWASARGASGVPGTMPGGMPSGGMGAAAPDAAWCASMTTWMTEQVERGRGGPMMWQTSGNMAATCREWMGSRTMAGSMPVGSMPGGSGSGAAWCDEMVTWMGARMGGWTGWMNGGGMNGGPMTPGTMHPGAMTPTR